MSEQNMTLEIASLRNENAVLKEELALANAPPHLFSMQQITISERSTIALFLIWIAALKCAFAASLHTSDLS
jgi:hypothetical protein